MLILQNVGYTHPDKDVLFDNLNLAVNRQDKIALIGNNGTGKSTLLRIMTGELQTSSGAVKTERPPYYVPQHFGQFNDYSVAQALRVESKLNALRAILSGDVTEANMALLDDDWAIEERCSEALAHWGLNGLDLQQKMDALSGGQKTKVFLAGIDIHRPGIVLLDEPGNHLDTASRQALYRYIITTTNTLIVVSHDRVLLNLLNTVCELSKHGLTRYGGNYDFYAGEKAIEASALSDELKSKEKALRKARDIERESLERQQKLDGRGKKKQERAGLPTISMNTLRNNAEKSTSRIKDIHAEKTGNILDEVNHLRKELPDKDKMKIGFDASGLHKGKVLITAMKINYSYDGGHLWANPLDLQITSGIRIAIKGANGSGKTTLIKILLGQLQPTAGIIERADINTIYIDQEYSLINNTPTIYEQAQQFNADNLEEHEIKSKLTHFLFTKADWHKPCNALSGGEKMRLIMCCLTIGSQPPDIIILDEPTNNLDIQNTEILTTAINEYRGTVIVVSHDAHFLEEIDIGEEMLLEQVS